LGSKQSRRGRKEDLSGSEAGAITSESKSNVCSFFCCNEVVTTTIGIDRPMFFTIQPWLNLQSQNRLNLAAQNVRQRDWLPSGKSREREVLAIGDEQREFLVEAVSDM
jgi:hypothetical protein